MLSRALSINYHDYVINLWRSANVVKVNLYLTGRIINGSAIFYYCAKDEQGPCNLCHRHDRVIIFGIWNYKSNAVVSDL